MNKIPTSHLDLVNDKVKAFVYLATIMDDGTPQVTPVWFNYDGENIYINSSRGRVKDHNMSARPQIALCIADPTNPYRYIQVRGRIIEFSEKEGDVHIDKLSLKYTGKDKYANRQPGEKRVRYKVKIEKVDAHG